jgi:ABC-type nitrate/sulfonate/bicarbonate transport system substrate-binding protein
MIRMMLRTIRTVACVGALAAALSPPTTSAVAQGKRFIVAAPGIPPIFASVQLYVAEKEGLFRKYGGNVEVRPFETGTAAARALIAGDIDMSLSPSALIINQISNADVNLVAVYGITNTDFVLASIDPAKTSCKDIAGQPVGVDTVGGARSIALRTMLAGGCPGVNIEDVQQVALSSNVAPAMLAGRLNFGVLHLDDVAVLEVQGRKVDKVLTVQKTDPNGHYLLFVVRRDKLQQDRQSYVRLVAALIDAARFIREPKNADRVAADAAPTGLSPAIAKATIKPLIDIDYWPVADDGLARNRLESLIGVMKRTGGIQADKTPVAYERLVDESVWKDAAALVK